MTDKNNSLENNILGYERILKLLYKFSVPAIIGMLVSALYNVVDRIYIGNSPDLGANGLAALTICFPAMIIMMSTGILFGQGGATLFSINLGRKNYEKADRVLGNATALLIIFGLLITIFGQIFLDKLLIWFGASPAILPHAKEYMRIILIGTVFQVISMGMNNFLRADGKPKMSMVTMLVSAGLNVILDPIFIYAFRMGMSGAAIATITSQFVSMVWSIHHFLKRGALHRIQLRYMKLDRSLALEITSLGMPGFLIQLFSSILNLILNNALITYGGDIAVSGMGIVTSLATLLVLPVIGLNQGLQPIVSFNYGARNYDRVNKAARLSIMVATCMTTFGFILIRAIPVLLVSMFNRDKELVAFSVHALQTWLMFLPFLGFQIIGANFFQAIGRPKRAMFLTLLRQVLILIPSILILSRLFGLNGILYAAPLADLSATIVTGILFFTFTNRIVNQAKKE